MATAAAATTAVVVESRVHRNARRTMLRLINGRQSVDREFREIGASKWNDNLLRGEEEEGVEERAKGGGECALPERM